MRKFAAMIFVGLLSLVPVARAATTVCSTIAISSFTGTSGTLTFATATQAYTSGTTVVLTGFTGGNTGLNNQNVTISATGLTTTHFEAAVTGSGYSSGTGSAINSYHNIECVSQSTFTGSTTNCNSAASSVISVTAGDEIDVWIDTNAAALTGAHPLTDSASNVYNFATDGTHTLNATAFTGGSALDAVFTAVALTTATLSMTLACTSGGVYEITANHKRSLVGTVGISCVAPFAQQTSVPISTTVTTSCTSATAAGMAVGYNDWGNSQPTACTGYSWMEDSGTEWSFQVKSVSATGSVNFCNTTTSSSDSTMIGGVVYNDGSSVAVTNKPHASVF